MEEDIALASDFSAGHRQAAHKELALAKGDLKTTIADILSLDEVAKNLHGQCDFLLKFFEERQSKRSQEIDALNQAKAIFSGVAATNGAKFCPQMELKPFTEESIMEEASILRFF